MKPLSLVWSFALAVALSFEASASTATFLGSGTGPGGVPVSASAVFTFSGDYLTITLTNTSPSNSGKDVPGSTLTGVFWNSVSNTVLTPVSATVAAGSSIIQSGYCDASCVGVTNVGGEFGYQVASFTGGADNAIASSGYVSNPGENKGNFNGDNLQDPVSLDGINFGIVSAASGFNPNPGQLSSVPLIQSSVVFVLSGATGLTIADITNVSFQYGTALSELNVPATEVGTVPEPGSAALLVISLLGWLATASRRKVRGRLSR